MAEPADESVEERMDPAIEAALDRLADAIVGLDEASAIRAAEDVSAMLGPGEAGDFGMLLLEWYFADRGIDGLDPLAAEAVTLAVMVRMAELTPHPVYAAPLAYAAEEAARDGRPGDALALARRGADLAEDADDLALALVWEAAALGALERPEEALLIARQADATASEVYPRLLARAVLLELLADALDPSGYALALDGLDWCTRDSEDLSAALLGAAILRTLINEANRWEQANQRPPVELAAALRSCLGQPAWTPGELGEPDIAAVVAWVDYLRDDLSRLDDTLALAGDGPFFDTDVAAQVAMLRVLGPYTRGDVAEMERRVRQAALIVRSASPKVIKAFKIMVISVVAPLQGGGDFSRILELVDDQDTAGTPWSLFVRAYDAVQAAPAGAAVPVDLCAELDAWCAAPVADDPGMMVALTALAGAVASITRDWGAAEQRMARARQLSSELDPEYPQAVWANQLVDGLSAAMLTHSDPAGGLAAMHRVHEANVDSGSEFAAFISAAGLTVAYGGRGEAAEAFRFGLSALAYLNRHRSVLPSSAERHSMRQQQEVLYATTIKAAARLGDPMLLAELLEYLFAQDMPVIHRDPDATQLPLATLLAAVPLDGARGEDVPDAVALVEPRPTLMPWGRLALADWIPPALNESAGAAPVPLRVARAGARVRALNGDGHCSG